MHYFEQKRIPYCLRPAIPLGPMCDTVFVIGQRDGICDVLTSIRALETATPVPQV